MMRIKLYPGTNPRHGPLGEVFEVDDAKGCDLVCRGMAHVIDHDHAPDELPHSTVVKNEPRRQEPPDDEHQPRSSSRRRRPTNPGR